MARNPLIIQRPQVSLIGGNQLPRASGLGVPNPNIAGPLAALGHAFISKEKRKKDKEESEVEAERQRAISEIRQRAEENRNLAESAAGAAEVESYDPYDEGTGKYNPLPPLDQYKHPRRNAALREAAFNKARTAIMNDVQTRLDLIDARTDIDDLAKVELGKEAVRTVIELLPPEMREVAGAWGSDEIRQRSQRAAQRTLEKKTNAAIVEADGRMKDFGDKAVSAIRSGDTTAAANALEETGIAIDDYVRLKDLDPKTGVQIKERLAREVKVRGIGARLRDHSTFGQIADPQMLWELGAALEHGTEVDSTLKAMTPGGRDRQRDIITYSANGIREQIGDEEAERRLGVELQQIAVERKAINADKQKDAAMMNALNRRTLDPNEPPPENLIQEFDAWNDEMIGRGDHKAPGGLEKIATLQIRFGKMSQPFLELMTRTAESGTYAEVQKAVAIWDYMKNANPGDYEHGQALIRTMAPESRALLDSIQNLFQTVENPDQFLRVRAESLKKGGSPDDTIQTYDNSKTTGEKTFRQLTDEKFVATFGRLARMPPEMREQFKTAFHTVTVFGGKSRQEAVDEAWKLIEEKWESNPIYLDHASPGQPLTNFPEYQKKYTTAPDWADIWTSEHEWVQETVKEIGTDLVTEGQLAMDERDAAEFQKQLAEQVVLGRTMWIRPTGNDKDAPQYTLWWMSPDDGQQMVRIVVDGKEVPLVLDLHYYRGRDAEAARETARKERENLSREEGEQEILEQKQEDLDYERFLGAQKRYNENLGLDPDVDPNAPIAVPYWQRKSETDAEQAVDPQTTGSINEWWENEKKLYAELTTTEPTGDEVNVALFQPKATGVEVAAYAAKAITNIVPMADGGQFLLDISGYESRHGTLPGSFRAVGDKGITQINTGNDGAYWGVKYQVANHPDSNVAKAAAKIKDMLGVDVTTATVQDLDKPIYAMAFARLHLLSDPRPIPAGEDVKSRSMRAYLYKQKYNSVLGAGSEEKFEAYVASDERKLISAFDYVAAPYDGEGSITDVSGKANPANFLGMEPQAQDMALRLSAAFGQPLQITGKGGKNQRSTGTPNHPAGLAIDIYVANMSDEEKTRLVATAVKLGYRGLGVYPPGSTGYGTVHFDIRPRLGNQVGNLALWYGNGSWTSAPRWFQNGITHGLAMKRANASV